MPDTIVVGAGVAGLTTAWYLRQAGQDVTVVDPAPASGASHAAAGMIAAVSEVVPQHDSIRDLTVASARAYPAFIRSLRASLGSGEDSEDDEEITGYRATATLTVGATSGDLGTFADLAGVQRASGMEVDRLSVRQTRRLEPALSPTIAGAFLAPDDHQINPRILTAALLQLVTGEQDGSLPGTGRLVKQRVSAVERAGDRTGRVTGVCLADDSVLHADTTVLCPGMSLDDIDGLPEAGTVHLRPVYGDILRARVRPGHPPLVERTVRGLVEGRPVYIVPRTDGEIVIGATEREDGFAGVSLEGVHQLLQDARLLVPGTADLELTEMIARARPGTPDDLPYLGRLPGVDGVVVSTGYSRHGVLLAPLCGRLAAVLAGATEHSTAQDADLLAVTAPDRT